MPFCEYCGNEIGYLPFNCNYCGGTFCKQHRLPENHDCSFELKHKPAVPTSSRKMRQSSQEIPRPISQDYLYKGPRQLKKYLKKQEKERKKARRLSQPRLKSPLSIIKMGNGTLFIIIMIVVFTIIELIQYNFYLYTNVITIYDLGIPAIYIWRIISTSFVYTQSIFSFLILFIMIIFLVLMGRMIELQYGTRFFIKFYFLCVLFKVAFYAPLILPLAINFPGILLFQIFIPPSSASAAIIGLISLMLFPMLNREITAFMYFFPVRTKGKTFLIIIILFIMLPALIGLIFYNYPDNLYYFALAIPDLGGVLAAYLVASQKIKLRK